MQQLNISIDGKITELIRSTQIASKSEGLIEGKTQGRQEADDRTDKLKGQT